MSPVARHHTGDGAANERFMTKKPRGKHRKRVTKKAPRPVVPDPSTWQFQDESANVIARREAGRRRRIAASQSGPIGSPYTLTAGGGEYEVTGSQARLLHQQILHNIAAVEDTIAKLPVPAPGIGHNKPPEPFEPLDAQEIQAVRQLVARLRGLPAVPTQVPTDTAQAAKKLGEYAKKVVAYVGKQADTFVTETVKTGGKAAPYGALWAMFGDQLIALANSIMEWIRTLTALGIH
jgi:hypothetical protein